MFDEDHSTVTSVRDVHQLKGWLPVDAVVRDGRPGLLWLDLRGVSFDQPFFADTIERYRQQLGPRSETFTDLDVLIQFENHYGRRVPNGLIFHASRCGSTAVANALKALENTVVFSEPYAADKLISRLFTDAQSHVKELLYSVYIRAVVGALGGHSGDGRYFVKFSATSGLHLSQLRAIWPDVPWVFIYRDPLEIVVSNLRDPPSWLKLSDNRMAAALTGLEEAAVESISRAELCAIVVGRLFEVAAENIGEEGRLVNYRELSDNFVLELVSWFGIECGKDEQSRLQASLRTYAKDRTGDRAFVSDSDEKQNSASEAVRVAVDDWASLPYEHLEQLRIDRSSERGMKK
jgi:hypothetical protein